MEIIIWIVKKTPPSTIKQTKNTLWDVGIDVSKTTITRRIHQHKLAQNKMQTNDKSQGQNSDFSLL